METNTVGENPIITLEANPAKYISTAILFLYFLVSNNNEFKQLFEYFKTRKKNPLKGSQALVAVAMKFLRVVHYLVINKEKYNSSRVLGEYREQQIAA